MNESFRHLVVLAFITILAMSITACGGADEEQPEMPPGHPGVTDSSAGEIPPVGVPVIEVPEEIKGKWRAVVLSVEDRTLGTVKDYTIGIGEALDIPDSDISVKVNEFFPAFLMNGPNITSASNNPENPAAKIEVKEGGALIFDSWLFAKYPTTHPFPHQRFGIILKEGIPS